MRITLSLVTVGTAFAAWATPAHAQTSCNAAPGAPCSLNHEIRAVAPTVAQLTQASQVTTFNVTAADFDNPAGKDASPFGLTVVANVNWTITVATAANTWTGGTKPSTDLRILIGGTPTGLSTTAQQLATGSAGTPPSILAQFNSLWHYATDPPGLYDITAVFTLSTP